MQFGRSLAQKITAVVLLATAIGLSTIVAALLVFDRSSSISMLRSRLATLGDVAGQNSTAALQFRDKNAANEVLAALRSEPVIVAACLYDQPGALFASYRRTDNELRCPATVAQIPASPADRLAVISSATRNNEAVGTLFLASDLADLYRRRTQILLIAGLLLMVALAVGGSAGVLLQRRITQPIFELADVMQSVSRAQDYSARVTLNGSDEIAQLGATFNIMLMEIERRDRDKKEAEAKLQHQALNDPLTGLPNRRLFADRLKHGLAQARRGHTIAAVLYLDLDGFKLVNDSLGHAVGDLLLAQVAQRLDARVRKSDTLARLGGDEFTIVLANLVSRNEAGAVAQTLLDALTIPFSVEEHNITISASIGISLYPENGTGAQELLEHADNAMYAAKRGGKNQILYYTDEIGSSVRERVNLETELRGAIQRREIGLAYQPEFDLQSNRLVRFEALARWHHPTLGPISPGKFIPIAEESGLIVPLGTYLMERACTEAVRWQQDSRNPMQVAVNVSSIEFMREDFVQRTVDILGRTGLAPHLLQLELTESIMLHGAEQAIASVKRLKQLGVSLAIDDFGTGYSSLGYLPRLPFDSIKIDQSFVHEVAAKNEKKIMLESLIALARKLHMRVIAEGVETVEQLALLRQLGAHEVQGFLLGRPISDVRLHWEKQTQARDDALLAPEPCPA